MKSIIFHTMKTIGKSIRVPVLSANPGDYPSAPFWDCPHQHAPFKERRATIQAYDDWKSTTERTLSVPCGLTWPSSCLTLAQVSLIFSPFFSPLSLRHGFVVVCFEVTTCELLCLLAAPCDLGDPGWGIPGFRMVLLLLRSPPGMALCFFGLSLLFLLPYLVKMIQCYHSCINSTMNWYLSHFWLAVSVLGCCGLFLVVCFLFGFFCVFVLFVFGFCCCFCLLW